MKRKHDVLSERLDLLPVAFLAFALGGLLLLAYRIEKHDLILLERSKLIGQLVLLLPFLLLGRL